jgi:HPt (histidine-containing phosphotransfer) domain-containing protein
MNVSPVDSGTLRELEATAGADFVRELVATFLAEAPRMLDDLREALIAGDAERFRRTAHSLKSNANTFGATALAAMARELELGGLDSGRAGGSAALDGLFDEYARVASALSESNRA